MNINAAGDYYINLVVRCLIEDLLFVDDKYVACLWAVS